MLEVTIADVSVTNVGFAIFLKPIEESGNRVVPIFIGPLETYSISSAMDGVTPPRPNTHDLMISMIEDLNLRLRHVVINDIVGTIFYARVVVEGEAGVVELDARPSDSVALALRAHCPIYMSEKVFNEAGVVINEESTGFDSEENDDDSELQMLEQELSHDESLSDDSSHAGAVGRSEVEELQHRLDHAVQVENFEEAARLRDQINHIKQEN